MFQVECRGDAVPFHPGEVYVVPFFENRVFEKAPVLDFGGGIAYICFVEGVGYFFEPGDERGGFFAVVLVCVIENCGVAGIEGYGIRCGFPDLDCNSGVAACIAPCADIDGVWQ